VARVKQAVFIRGENLDERFVWDYFHFDPRRNVKPGVITLVYFDFPNGVRKTWSKWLPKNGSRPRGSPDETAEIRKIRVGTRDLATVLDLYDWVKAQELGSIITFQTFTHGWEYGPVLWNEPNDATTPYEEPRSPTDTEFRIRDFHGDNTLTGVEIIRFAGSFASDAFVKLWGCNHQEETVALVRNYLQAEKRKDEAQRKAHLRDYLSIIEQTFVAHMCRALGMTVYAAPAGWGTDWARDGTTYRGVFPPNLDNNDRWWGPGLRFTKQHEAMFRKVLKAKLDAVRYVGYNSSWIDEAKRAVAEPVSSVSPIKTPRDLQQDLLDELAGLHV
jgi:hypothetical protein